MSIFICIFSIIKFSLSTYSNFEHINKSIKDILLIHVTKIYCHLLYFLFLFIIFDMNVIWSV